MKYVLGVDFGTLSARAVLLRASDGAQIATAACGYGAYDVELPGGLKLRPLSCLAVPSEYRKAFEMAVRETMRLSGVSKEDVVGIGVDSTSCTLVGLDENGTPVCEREEFANLQDAYIKVWKSHSASQEAEDIERCAKENNEPFINSNGHKISSEWFFVKMLETLNHAPQVYHAAKNYIDAADWINYLLTGKVAHSVNALALKGFWYHGAFPSSDFWRKVNPAFADANEKMESPITRWGEKMGELTEEAAEWLGLCPGIAVGCAGIDGHTPIAALGMNRDGDLLLSLGTSNVEALSSRTYSEMPGICGMGENAGIPGFTLYDAGQAACGDMLAWYMENMLPESIAKEAREKGVSPHAILSERGLRTAPDANGLVVLDWFNGNRCPYARAELRSRMDGFSLWTRPEHIYRAMVESMAFGARQIIENMESHGCAIGRIISCGGIAVKNPDLVQCFADIFGREILVSNMENAAANGSGVLAAKSAGLYETLDEAIAAMSTAKFRCYTPNAAYKPAYDKLFARYLKLGQQTLADAEA